MTLDYMYMYVHHKSFLVPLSLFFSPSFLSSSFLLPYSALPSSPLHPSSSSLSLAQLSQVGMLSKAVGMGTYVDSQWGLAQFSLPSEVPCLCAFLPDRKCVIGEQHTAAGIPVKTAILS